VRSSHIQWKNYFLFAIPENLPIFRNRFFTGRTARAFLHAKKAAAQSVQQPFGVQ